MEAGGLAPGTPRRAVSPAAASNDALDRLELAAVIARGAATPHRCRNRRVAVRREGEGSHR